MAKFISSSSNDIYKKLLDLSKSSGIKKHKQFLVMGEKIIRDNLADLSKNIVAEIRTETMIPFTNDSLQWVLSPELFKNIDIIGTSFNLFLLDYSEIPTADLLLAPQGLEIIAPLGDPTNLGSLARTAWAFGIKNLILTSEAANPYHPKAIKASSGALLKMKLSKTGPLNELEGQSIWALDLNGENLNQVQFPKNLRLLLGEEGPGLSALKNSKAITKRISIPIQGVESLNATVAGSIALYEYRKQF